MVINLESILLTAVLVLLAVLIYLLLRLTDKLQRGVGENSRRQEERLDRLNTNLDSKLSSSLHNVSSRLEEVQKGLGSMETVATGVGDLKKVLTNVKNRGIWGEMQLGNLLRDILAPEQYELNVAISPRSSERVEFALKLPGVEPDQPIWLPIDAKFPQEDFQRLVEAREAGDTLGAAEALKQLEIRLKGEAKDIRDKYIKPPYSTDFGLMYLPTEGLFAEAVNLPGLMAELQRKYRVTIAGPTTLAALLNSLQMGFRTLAIQKQTGEMAKAVIKLQEDFAVFAENLQKVAKKLAEAQNSVSTAADRARILQKRLAKVEEFTKKLDNDEKYE